MTVLTVPAGAVDAVSFLTMGKVFCAPATGNVLFLSFALAGEGDVPVARPAVAIGAFMAGAGVVLQRLARTRWTATVGGIFSGGVLGTLLLMPLGTSERCPSSRRPCRSSRWRAWSYHRACGNGYRVAH